MSYAPIIKRRLLDQGAELPIQGLVSVRALFYRETAVVADIVGYQQALGDWLQAPKLWRLQGGGVRRRNGAGIIDDDAQIEHWDGSRRYIDRVAPRIEVEIQVLTVQQGKLLDTDGDH